jgi:hypothetical protein
MTKEQLKNNLNGGSTSAWAGVTIAFIFFFPLGLYMGQHQLAVSKVAAAGGVKVSRIPVGMLFLFGGLWGIAGLAMLGEEAAAGLILLAMGGGTCYGGASILNTAKKYEALAPKYGRFLVSIVNHDCYNIEQLAEALGCGYSTTLKHVEEMVELGLFQGAYIDYTVKELVWGERPASRSVTCPSCAASNQVVAGRVNKCQYCGSGL